MERLLAPDTEVLEDVCENESDRARLSGERDQIQPGTVATYAGVYELAPGREVVVAVTGDLLFVQGLNDQASAALQSETQFMSTATPEASSSSRTRREVTHIVVRGAAGDQKAVRKKSSLISGEARSSARAALRMLRSP